jgi:sporulation protein YlmC with PRC-barrel domain
MKRFNRTLVILALGAGLAFAAPLATAQQAATGAAATHPSADVAIGWSVKKSLLGKSIYNEKEESIGVINDLLIGPDSTISHVIVGMAGKDKGDIQDVAIDASALQVHDGKFYVQVGATGAAENVNIQAPIDYAKFL